MRRDTKGFNLNQVMWAVGLWVLFAVLVAVRNPIDRVVNHSIWPRLVLSGNWAPADWRERARRRLIFAGTDGDAKLLVYLIHNGPEKERYRWAAQLARVHNQLVGNEFLRLAQDSDSSIRKLGIQYLAKHGDMRAAETLAEGLASADPDVVSASVAGLGRLKVAKVLPQLMAFLAKPQAPDVLSDFEVLVGRTATKLAEQPFDFNENCHIPHSCDSLAFLRYKMELEKFPERAKELTAKHNEGLLSIKRQFCKTSGPVAARKELLKWWDRNGTAWKNRAG